MRGAIWVATGKAHVDAAVKSARTFKESNPKYKTALFTDLDLDAKGFDFVRKIPNNVIRPKIEMLSASPFDQTLYLDNDTLILDNLSAAYDILEKFEMAGCQVQLWQRPRHNQVHRIQVPILFPEINCGVLLYKKCVKTDEFFKRWSHEFRKSGLNVDQTTFRETLWDSDIKFHVLPEQLNKRLIDPCELIYTDKPSPFIVHLPVLRPAKNLFQKFKSALSRRYYLSKRTK